MKKPKILAFVMAGGEGARLQPLTVDNSKPSLPFGSRYRIVAVSYTHLDVYKRQTGACQWRSGRHHGRQW